LLFSLLDAPPTPNESTLLYQVLSSSNKKNLRMFSSIARPVVARAASIRAPAVVRAFSSECEPAQKLKCIFEEYRREQ
jgi:hypothetical protein